jgi:hypothetical protein
MCLRLLHIPVPPAHKSDHVTCHTHLPPSLTIYLMELFNLTEICNDFEGPHEDSWAV